MYMVDYRQFQFAKLHTKEFSHLKLLIFWPLNGIVFSMLEHYLIRDHHFMYCRIDDYIPFNEYFAIPYLGWFVFLFGMLTYSLLMDIPAFRRYMWFTIITYSCTMLIYLLYPNAQNLRPASFENNNIFTQIASWLYSHDTNTNVCPSIHATGSIAVVYAAWNSKRFHSAGWRAGFVITGFFIAISTVFMKQHSIIDVFCSVVLCALAYPVVRRITRMADK